MSLLNFSYIKFKKIIRINKSYFEDGELVEEYRCVCGAIVLKDGVKKHKEWHLKRKLV